MMHEPAMMSAAPISKDIDRQIAAQDVVIAAIAERLAVAAAKRTRFSYRALYSELSLEAELAVARDVRGALLYDRSFAQRQH